jgi:uncharacterized protein
MKWFLFVLTILIASCSSKVTVTEDEIGSDVFYCKGSYRPYTGKCTVLFNNSTAVKEEFTFKNGILNGKAITWYKNGKIRQQGCYQDGLISGNWEFWDSNGNKILNAHYTQNFLDGPYTSLFPNGKIREKGQFSANKRTGAWVFYTMDGQIVHTNFD